MLICSLAIRLLIPEGSLLLDLAEVRALVGLFDARALSYPWRNPELARSISCAPRLTRRSSANKNAGLLGRKYSARSGASPR